MNKYKIIDKGNGIGLVDYYSEHWYEIEGMFPECVNCGGSVGTGDLKCLDCGADIIFKKIKSVSMVIGTIDKGYGFKEWLKSVGPNADFISRKAADSGTKLHNAFEKSILGQAQSVDEGDFDQKEWGKYNNWADWYEGLEIKPYHVELSVYGNWNDDNIPAPNGIDKKQWEWMNYVAGTADLIARVKYQDSKGSGKNKIITDHADVWLLDWKTGNSIYETSHLQLASYAKMYNDMVDKGILSTPKVTRAGLVHVGASNKTKSGLNNVGIKVEEVDIKRDIESFRDTLKVFNRFNPNLKAPSDRLPLTRKIEKGLFLPAQ
jgi:hypothetical protein